MPITHDDIKILDVTHLKGPSVWTYRPVLEALVDIGGLEDWPSNTLPGFVDRLCAWLPTLVEHRCSYEVRGGFVRRLQEGTWPAHILEHVTLELQNMAGMPGGFGKAREVPIRGVYKVIVRAWHETVTRAALFAARDLVMAAINDRPFDVAATVATLREMTDDLLLGPSTGCIVDAADDRDIPFIRLNDGNLVQLGQGSRMRRIWTAETDRTGAIAEGISRDKELTRQLLAGCGVPVPVGRRVENPEDAWAAAEDIGLPVVVKPDDGNHGRGVFTNLTTRDEVAKAWQVADGEGSGVIVERFIRGNEHRLLVVGDRMVAAARGEPAGIVGDGRSTVEALIESQINADPRRGTGEDCPLNRVRIDSAARIELARQGLTAESVPEAGREVLVQRNGNVAFDVTDRVHPDVAADVVLAARIVGLDIAGIDLVAEDIGRPLGEQGGAIVEVNAGPGLLMHLKPADGEPRPVGRAIVDHLFPDGDDGRIPVIGVTGAATRSGRITPVARIIAHMLRLGGRQVGLGCSGGLYLGRRCIDAGNGATWSGGRRLLQNRLIDAVVLENGPRMIATEGLAYDRCQVGIVTGIDEDAALPDRYIAAGDPMATLLRTQVDVVLESGTAVLNAHDARVAAMAEYCDGDVILFATDPTLPVVIAHLEAGKRAVLVDGRELVIATGRHRDRVLQLDDVAPRRWRGDIAIESLLAAVGAACALQLRIDLIGTAINTFVPEHDEAKELSGA